VLVNPRLNKKLTAMRDKSARPNPKTRIPSATALR
jgi:hypothetical protein